MAFFGVEAFGSTPIEDLGHLATASSNRSGRCGGGGRVFLVREHARHLIVPPGGAIRRVDERVTFKSWEVRTDIPFPGDAD